MTWQILRPTPHHQVTCRQYAAAALHGAVNGCDPAALVEQAFNEHVQAAGIDPHTAQTHEQLLARAVAMRKLAGDVACLAVAADNPRSAVYPVAEFVMTHHLGQQPETEGRRGHLRNLRPRDARR